MVNNPAMKTKLLAVLAASIGALASPAISSAADPVDGVSPGSLAIAVSNTSLSQQIAQTFSASAISHGGSASSAISLNSGNIDFSGNTGFASVTSVNTGINNAAIGTINVNIAIGSSSGGAGAGLAGLAALFEE